MDGRTLDLDQLNSVAKLYAANAPAAITSAASRATIDRAAAAGGGNDYGWLPTAVGWMDASRIVCILWVYVVGLVASSEKC